MKPGQIANLSRKLETNPPVVLAGLSELLKPCQTVFVLPLAKPDKIEFQLKIFYLAAVLAVMDAMVVILQLHGTTSPTLD